MTTKTSKIIELEKKFLAQNYAPLPVVITKAKGCYAWDIEGNKYIDMMSAYSAVSFGHNNPQIIKTLSTQAKKLSVISRAFHTDQLAAFVQELCLVSKMDKALPMNSGAEAVETAIKAARLWGYKHKNIPPEKAEIIVARNNFHGRTTGIISFSSEPAYKENFAPFMPGFKEIEFANSHALTKAITPNTCAFLVEPIQGEAGVIVPPQGYLKQVQNICQSNNILLILDEIQSGLGRTGKDFAYMHEIDRPDGLIVGKALGGGVLPVSAFLATNQVMDLFKPGSHGSTFGGNPLACAVGLAALKILTNGKLSENSLNLGKYLNNLLLNINSPVIKDIRGKGLWFGVEIDPKYATAKQICYDLLSVGILTKDTHHVNIRLAPPLIVTSKILDLVIHKFTKVIKKYEK